MKTLLVLTLTVVALNAKAAGSETCSRLQIESLAIRSDALRFLAMNENKLSTIDVILAEKEAVDAALRRCLRANIPVIDGSN